MGSTSVSAPAPSAEETAIMREQLDLMRQSRTEQQALRPFVLSSLRLTEGEGGALRRMTEEEFRATLSGPDLTAYENLQLAQERERKALAGELPLTEAGQQRKSDEFRALKEQMARLGNPITGDTPETASATTTSGIQGLKAFQERWGLLEEAERFGEISSGTSAILQRMGVASDIGARQQAGLLQFPAGPAALAQGFGGLLQPYQFQRELQFRAAQERAANRAGLLGGAGQLIGTLGSAALFSGLFAGGGAAAGAGAGAAGSAALFGLASARRFKKNIAPATKREEDEALEMVMDLKTKTYRYKHEPKSVPKRMGLLADEAPAALVTPDRQGLDVGRMVGLLTAATRALARQTERRA